MGFEKEVLQEGTGPAPTKGSTVTVHCEGIGKNGDLNVPFWSTKDPGQTPFTFKIGMGGVIKAWDEGVMTMKVGEKSIIKASPDYAYGAGGFAAWGILPNSPLNFVIEVLSVN
ncbi:peptidyl-prolyl isomerase fkbp12 [Nannochloropsis oceanica]